MIRRKRKTAAEGTIPAAPVVAPQTAATPKAVDPSLVRYGTAGVVNYPKLTQDKRDSLLRTAEHMITQAANLVAHEPAKVTQLKLRLLEMEPAVTELKAKLREDSDAADEIVDPDHPLLKAWDQTQAQLAAENKKHEARELEVRKLKNTLHATPYSVDRVIERVQILIDGLRQSNEAARGTFHDDGFESAYDGA